MFQKFVDDQIRAIELTKVKLTKRKGVIACIKIFPPFSAAVENVYHGAAGHADGTPAVLQARQMIDEAYTRINKAMWDCLKHIAADARSTVIPGQAVDPDKQAMNHLILMVENMHHYIEEVDDGGVEGSALAEWKARALMDRAEALEEYVGKVVSRPLGKVLVSQYCICLARIHINEENRYMSKRQRTCWLRVCPDQALLLEPPIHATTRRRILTRTSLPKTQGPE